MYVLCVCGLKDFNRDGCLAFWLVLLLLFLLLLFFSFFFLLLLLVLPLLMLLILQAVHITSQMAENAWDDALRTRAVYLLSGFQLSLSFLKLTRSYFLTPYSVLCRHRNKIS